MKGTAAKIPHPADELAVIRELKKRRTFFIAGHQNPDGDTLGCGLALASVLKRLGKKTYIFSADPVPENLLFLPGIKTIHAGKLPPGSFEAAVLLECSTPGRAGYLGGTLEKCGVVLNIDHHRTFEPYGHVNYVNPAASSTAEILYGFFEKMKIPLTRHEAECLYVGLATDTGRFHYPSTTARAHEVASGLIRAGAGTAEINNLVYSTRAFPALKLLGAALNRLELSDGGKTAVSFLTRKDIVSAGASTQHAEDIVNYGLMVPGTGVSVMFREEEGRIAVNFRSKGAVDVSLIAKKLGGGGHRNAAGCKLRVPLKEAMRKTLAVIKAAAP